MSDSNNTGDKTLGAPPTKTLTLKRPVEQGTVRQSFSHGRTKQVVVEVKHSRFPAQGAAPARPQQAPAAAPAVKPVAPKSGTGPAPRPPAAPPAKTGVVLRTLTDEERDARTQALMESRRREEEDRKRMEAEERQRREREERDRKEREAAEARKREEEDRRRAEMDARRRSEDEAKRRLGEEAQASSAAAAAPRGPRVEIGSPRGAAPRAEGGFRSGPPREREPGGRGDGPRQGFAPRDGAARPAGTARFGFAPKPGAGPAGRPAGAGPGMGQGPRSADGAPRGPRPGGPRPGPGVFGGEPAVPPPPSRVGAPVVRPSFNLEDDDSNRGPRRTAGPGKPPVPARPERAKAGEAKSRGRLTVQSAFADEEERQRSVAAFRRRVQRLKGAGAAEQKEKIAREVTIPETISIQELANRMAERGVDVIRLLMKQGQMHKITDVIDADTAQLVAEEMGHTVKRVAESDVVEGLFDAPDADETLETRPPVVTIMGHVDHGKTSLLDAIRQTNVVSGEAGGITQHIGAYQVTSPLGGKITFIDTPGHAAFTAMRARGARVTDIVILVVAADDGVMPQTIEAINHAKAAKVPMIVAINKIDKPEAKPERVRTELLQHEVQVEEFGGDTIDVEVSAKQKLNLDKLLEIIQLQAEVLDLKANPLRAAEGSVVEAKLDRGRGPVATVLVQRGTLKQGDIVVAGSEWGRVRALINDKGEHVPSAGPSVPVEILGFTGAPEAGDRMAVVENEARAREITAYRIREKRDKAAMRGGGAGSARSLADMMSQIKQAGRKEVPVVVKGDVQGSVEAIVASLDKLSTDEVACRVLHSGVGGITESDITLAHSVGAVVIGFNVRAHKEAREMSERNGVEIRYYNIIYDLVDDVKKAMSGLLAPTLRETMLGNATILEVFNITKVGNVAGCQVTDGKVERGAKVRLIRDNVVIHEGTLKTLKRFKDEVKEVQVGQECGMAFENYEDMRKGDVIECFRVEEIQRSL
jgi:translation initiation factor IF-2